MDSQVPAPPVGVDVVDLEEPRLPRGSRLQRFRRRVLAAEEMDTDLAPGKPAPDVWLRWAAKEATFKAAVAAAPGVDERPSFRPSAFRVEPGGAGVAPPPGVLGNGFPLRVVHPTGEAWGWADTPGSAVVAVAWPPDGGGVGGAPEVGLTRVAATTATTSTDQDWRSELRSHFTNREWSAVHSLPSARVRLAVRHRLAQWMGVSEEEVEVTVLSGSTGRAPPVALVRGRRVPVGISLSHHGAFVAWAIWVAGEGSPEAPDL